MTKQQEKCPGCGSGKQQCSKCGHQSIKGLAKGNGLCPYHWAVAQWGETWANQCYPNKAGHHVS